MQKKQMKRTSQFIINRRILVTSDMRGMRLSSF